MSYQRKKTVRVSRKYDTLVLEGGSLRCAFTAGVLDTFAAVGYNPFRRCVAVSAGAMALTSFLSGQRKHFIDVATDVAEDGQFIRLMSALSEEGVMNLAHLFDHVRRHRPLDLEAAAHNARRSQIRFVTTDYDTGKPLYLNPVAGDWLRILWASATLPMVTRGRIKVGGKWMFDGGISDALPLDAAIGMGAKNILVVRTRPSGDHYEQSWMDVFATYWYKENPAIVDLYENGHHHYNRVVDRLKTRGEGKVSWREIAPLSPLRSEGFRVQKEDLLADYHHGLSRALDWFSGEEEQ